MRGPAEQLLQHAARYASINRPASSAACFKHSLCAACTADVMQWAVDLTEMAVALCVDQLTGEDDTACQLQIICIA